MIDPHLLLGAWQHLRFCNRGLLFSHRSVLASQITEDLSRRLGDAAMKLITKAGSAVFGHNTKRLYHRFLWTTRSWQ
jgi:hypothetical protein